MNMNAGSETKDIPSKDSDPIFEHVADYIIQTLIKEDVNAFSEAKLLHELLTFKLHTVAGPLMYRTVSDGVALLKKDRSINLVKEIGGINTQKRLHFRSKDQYNAFIMLFFRAVEEHPELLEPVDDEETFERLMIYCIHEFREKLDGFAMQIARERTTLEHEYKVYIHRRNSDLVEIPTYADFIAERIDSLA